MTPAQLNIFASRLDAVCDEMGAVLRNAAFSPNIRDRLDFSCAIFDPEGALCAQAAHIPVHLGSMAFAMRDVVSRLAWAPGDQVMLNDPYLGGTHLPDVTLIAPVFCSGRLRGFVVNRAHHADIGAANPGSMPISSSLDEEGMLIAPTRLLSGGVFERTLFDELLSRTRSPIESEGDFSAQLAANRAGVAGLSALVDQYGAAGFETGAAELNAYAGRLARAALRRIPDGVYAFEDCLDDDGQGNEDIPIRLALRVHDGLVEADFSATAAQVSGNVNCPLSVTAAGVFYAFRCLMPMQTPACAGAFEGIRLKVPAASLLNAVRPAAVAAGNVETSSRVVDVVLGALAKAIPGLIPAASHGSMNNFAVGSGDPAHAWDYYETMGGGMGAGRDGGGLSALQTHMTNTLNTPVEVLESRYPLRVTQYRIRRGSGGAGERRGGDGLVREFEFLAPAHFTLLTERRRHAPWPVGGAAPGRPGRNLLNGQVLGAKCEGDVQAGDRLCVETPGGGGWSAEITGDD